jgi:hypothetical protein
MTLLGGILGVILNIIFPNWLVLLPLSMLLAVVAYRTIGKGRLQPQRTQHTVFVFTTHVVLRDATSQEGTSRSSRTT